MALAGNEEKIQGLFRELKLADERIAPEFNRVWNRAQATTPGSPHVFKVSFAVATVLVIAWCSVLLWSRNWRRSRQSNPIVATAPITPGSTPGSAAPQSATAWPALPGMTEPRGRVKPNRAYRKFAARRQPELNVRNRTNRTAVTISSWQSPTASLMQSPADDVLTSLPQLDQSLTGLKTFLPNTPQ